MSVLIKANCEDMYKEELEALRACDKGDKPHNWLMSPRAVRSFILGESKALSYEGKSIKITPKFMGNDALVERCIIALASNRPLLLIGEPGTAKSYLSELLSTAISGTSTNTIQGSIGLSEDMIKYSWNYALLIAKGPIKEALVPAPIYTGMQKGIITRFEEITRTPLEIQDCLISILSDKIISIPELKDEPYLQAQRGFNVIATANTRDKGVNEMSSALKRRFNFETVEPLNNIKLETLVIKNECQKLMEDLPQDLINLDMVELLATVFNELRNAKSIEGGNLPSVEAVLSTAEAVSIYHQTMVDAHYYHNDVINLQSLVHNMTTAIVKDNKNDLKLFKNYLQTKLKTKQSDLFNDFANLVMKL